MLAAGGALALTVLAQAAKAQTYTVTVVANGAMGNLASAASGDTVFQVDSATGGVTKISGNGARISTGSARAQIRINCGNQNACDTYDVNVRIGQTGSPTLRAKPLTAFEVTMNTAVQVGSTSGANPINFRIGPVGKNSNKTFYVGADFTIEGDNSTDLPGAADAGFYVYVARYNNTPVSVTGSTTPKFTSTVFRSLSMTKQFDLAFGRIVRPKTGSGTVTFDSTTNPPNGTLTVTGGVAIGGGTNPAKIASYTVTGESGKTISVTVPSSFNLTGPSTITVTTNKTAVGVITLTGGSYAFRVGGSFDITSSTPTGDYSGSFNVTANYN